MTKVNPTTRTGMPYSWPSTRARKDPVAKTARPTANRAHSHAGVCAVDCDLEATVSFADTETGPVTRTEVRSVRVRPGTAAFFASVGEEPWSSIDAAGCRPRPDVDAGVATWFETLDHEAEPEGCWDAGCIGFDVIPHQDCAQADVQFAVYDDYGALGNPHDLVIPLELREGVTVTAWAGGIDSFEGDAVLTRISCR